MNNQFIEKSLFMAEYDCHTNSAFHNSILNNFYTIPKSADRDRAIKEEIARLVGSGYCSILPFKLSLLNGNAMPSINNVGRAKVQMIAQLKGHFTKIEDSPYMKNKPFNIHTGLWKAEGYQSYYFGSIGVTGANGIIDRDNADLIIIHTFDWKHLKVYIFRGLAGTNKQMDYLSESLAYLQSL